MGYTPEQVRKMLAEAQAKQEQAKSMSPNEVRQKLFDNELPSYVQKGRGQERFFEREEKSREAPEVGKDLVGPPVEGVYEGIRNAGEFLTEYSPSRLGTWALDKATGTQSPDTRNFKETVPAMKDIPYVSDALVVEEKSPLQNFGYEMGTMLPGGLFGGAVTARLASKLIPNAITFKQKAMKPLIAGLGADIGAAATEDLNINPLFADDLARSLEVLGTRKDNGEFEQTLMEARLTHMADALVVGGVASAGLGAGQVGLNWLGGLIYKSRVMFDKGMLQEDIAGKLLDWFSDIDPWDDAANIAAKKEEAVKYVRSRLDEFQGALKFSELDENLTDEAASVPLTRLKKDFMDQKIDKRIADIENSNLSPSAKSDKIALLNIEKERNLSQVRAVERGLEAGEGGAFQATQESGPRQLRENLGRAENIKSAGGIKDPDEGLASLRDTTEEQMVGVPKDRVTDLENQARAVQEDIVSAINNEEYLRPLADELAAKVNMRPGEAISPSGRKLGETLVEARERTKQLQKGYWEAIPPETNGDMNLVLSTVDEVGLYQDKNILEAIQKTGGKLKKLGELGRGPVQQEITQAIATKDMKRAKQLISLKDSLTRGQLGSESVQTSVSGAGKAAVERAYRFEDEIIGEWKDNDLLSQLWYMGGISKPGHRAYDFAEPVERLLDQSNRSVKKQPTLLGDDQDVIGVEPMLRKSFPDPEDGRRKIPLSDEGSKPLADFNQARLANDLQEISNTKGPLTDQTIDDFRRRLQESYPIIDRVSPEIRPKLEELFTKVRDRKLGEKAVKEQLAEAGKQLQEAEIKYYKELFPDFFDGGMPKNPSDVYVNLVKNKSPERIKEIMKLADQQGVGDNLRSGVFRALKDDILYGNTKSSAGNYNPNREMFKELSEKRSALYKNLETMLGEKPAKFLQRTAKGFNEVISQTGGTREELLRAGQVRVKGSRSINTGITWVFGILNPTAARLRTITSDLIENADPENTVLRFIDDFMAEPEKWLKIAEGLPNDVRDETARRVIKKAAARAGILPMDEEEFLDENSQPTIDDEMSSVGEEETGNNATEKKSSSDQGASLRSYEPTLRERIGNLAYDLTGSQHTRDVTNTVVDFVPGVSEALGIDDTQRALDEGRYFDAGVNATAATLGVIPIAGDVLGKGVKRVGQEWADKFHQAGRLQRGDPESAMLKVQNAYGGGLLNPVVEHSGDVLHRMTDFRQGGPGWIQESFRDKINKVHRWLTHPYGFEKEMSENMVSNAKARGIPLEEHKAKVDNALSKFAEEHSKLPSYNRTQWLVNKANVAIGKQEWETARDAYDQLKQIADLPDEELAKKLQEVDTVFVVEPKGGNLK